MLKPDKSLHDTFRVDETNNNLIRLEKPGNVNVTWRLIDATSTSEIDGLWTVSRQQSMRELQQSVDAHREKNNHNRNKSKSSFNSAMNIQIEKHPYEHVFQFGASETKYELTQVLLNRPTVHASKQQHGTSWTTQAVQTWWKSAAFELIRASEDIRVMNVQFTFKVVENELVQDRSIVRE